MGVLRSLLCSFPWSLWYELLPQVEMNINMLRRSNVAPTIFEYAHINGPHNYNFHQLAPLGCELLLHKKPSQRSSCSMHSINFWYKDTYMEHFRNFSARTKETKLERISDIFFLNTIPNISHGNTSRCGGEITEGPRKSVPRISSTQ